MLVVDASLVTEPLLGTPLAAPIRDALGDDSIHAPELVTAEVGSVIRRLMSGGEIDEAIAHRAVAELGELGIERYEHQPLLARTLELRHLLTTCDALYVALAEALGVPLLTCDSKLAAAHGHQAIVRLIMS